jgi:peptide subunit release factor 1 (eRF1)
VTSLLEHALADRRVGVLLVRLGGYAAGVFEGEKLVLSKVDSRLVHGRQRNGGSSQKRYARRRENEVRDLIEHAADLAVRLLVPEAPKLDAVVFGGDARAIEQVLADRRLAPLAARRAEPFLTVPDPKRAILESTPPQFRAVRIHVSDPTPA